MSHKIKTTFFLTVFISSVNWVYAQQPTAMQGRDTNSVEAVQSLEAYAKYKMAEYEAAKDIWLKLAEKDNTSALINLANLYEQGQGVERDLEVSVDYLTRAANLNDIRGQFQLGMAYEKGLGVERDLKQAAYWFEQAAKQGDEQSQFNLGVMLATNFGQGLMTSSIEQRQQALMWLKKADSEGVEDAQEFIDLLQTIQ